MLAAFEYYCIWLILLKKTACKLSNFSLLVLSKYQIYINLYLCTHCQGIRLRYNLFKHHIAVTRKKN